MKLYVYEVDTLKIVAEIEGEDNYDCESKALDQYPGTQILTPTDGLTARRLDALTACTTKV